MRRGPSLGLALAGMLTNAISLIFAVLILDGWKGGFLTGCCGVGLVWCFVDAANAYADQLESRAR